MAHDDSQAARLMKRLSSAGPQRTYELERKRERGQTVSQLVSQRMHIGAG